MLLKNARTQYNDFLGTSSADSRDRNAIDDYLRQKGLISNVDMVFGVSIYTGENHMNISVKPNIIVYVVRNACNFVGMKDILENATNVDDVLDEINIQLDFNEFFGLFKRFHVVIERDLDR